MIDKKTTHLKLPLPNVENELEDDCPRLEDALKKLDAHAAAGDARIKSVEARAENLGQQTTNNEKAVGILAGRTSSVESRVSAVEAGMGQTSAMLQAHGTALQNCDATLLDHAEGLAALSTDKASKAELEVVESSVNAVSTTFIGSVISMMAADGYVPNGAVPANGGEYTRAQFPSLYDTYLAGGKLLTCTYAAWAAQVALTGNCAKFAVDAAAQKFKVPLLKNGDSITHAASAAELGKSYKAGLPNITASRKATLNVDAGTTPTGAYQPNSIKMAATAFSSGGNGAYNLEYDGGINASLSDPIYGNSSTVTDEQVRLRHFVVLASAQNNASMFDWSNYMAALAEKLNADFSNKPSNIAYVVEAWRSGYNWYRKWSDGYIEQGVRYTGPGGNGLVLTLPTPMMSASSYTVTGAARATGGAPDYGLGIQAQTATTITFGIGTTSPLGADFMVCGF